MKFPKHIIVSIVVLASLAAGALAGSLTPPGTVGSTMNSLADLYASIAGTFDSTSITSSATGSLIQHLKYIEANMSSGGVSSNSLDFDELVNSMNLDANNSIASHGFSTTWNGNFYHMQGNVGIGTTSPTAKLAVSGSATFIGGELVTNGTFTGSAAGWTLGANCAYATNSVTCTNAGGDQSATTDFSTTAGSTYVLTFTISGSNAPMSIYLFNSGILTFDTGPFRDGTHTVTFQTDFTGTETIAFDGWNYALGDTFTLDNVSIREGSVGSSFAALGPDGSSWLEIGDDTLTNTALGKAALSSITTGGNNNAFGVRALYSNTTGQANNAFGNLALNANTTGSYNNALGHQALLLNTTGIWNNAIGYSALGGNTTGSSNNALGHLALFANTTGIANNAFGAIALRYNTTGTRNNAVGQEALEVNTTGSYNSAFGQEALGSNTTGAFNTALGSKALFSNTIGSDNISVGASAGYTTLGSGNVFLGRSAGYDEHGSNTLWIENSNVASSSALIYGEFDNDYLSFGANVSVSGNFTVGDTFYAQHTNGYVNDPGSFQYAISGAANVLDSGVAGDVVVAANGQAVFSDSAGTTDTTIGGQFETITNGAGGTVTNAYGVSGFINGVGSTAITNAIGGSFSVISSVSTTITNAYALKIGNVTGASGSITNNYGLYIDDQDPVGDNLSYNLYSAGTGLNYFGDNVGIGVAVPEVELEILGVASVSDNIRWGQGANMLNDDQGGSIELGGVNTNPVPGGAPFIDFHYGNGLAQDYNYRLENSADEQIDFSVSAGVTMTLLNRRLGVGTVTPAVLVHIASSTFDGNILRLQDSNGTCDHNPGAVTEEVTCSSDERLKTNIVDSALNALDYLNGFRLRDYTIIAGGAQVTGVIAQELQETHPELVVTDSASGYLMVTHPTVWTLVKGIQELASKQFQLEDILKNQEHATSSAPDPAGIIATVLNAFRDLIVTVRELIAPKVTTNALQMTDSATGQVYCVRITNGEFAKTVGECATDVPVSPTPDATPTPSDTPTPSETPTPSDTPLPDPTEIPSTP